MIRFKIDILEELKNKGFSTNKMREEKKNGNAEVLSESTAQAIRTAWKNGGGVNINLKAVNFICKTLKKQPGQLLEYIPDNETSEND